MDSFQFPWSKGKVFKDGMASLSFHWYVEFMYLTRLRLMNEVNFLLGVDWDAKGQKKSIFKIQGEGKTWASGVDKEKGSFDYVRNSSFANRLLV